MKIHITSGTHYFLNKKLQKHSEETMILMENSEQAVLLHETNGPSLFYEPRSFEIIDTKGTFIKRGFVVMQHFTVTEEGKPLFEYRMKDIPNLIETMTGYLGIRCLRPLNSKTYMILTLWDKELSYKNWRSSKAYDQFDKLITKDSGIDSIPNIFSKPSYVSTYYISDYEGSSTFMG